MHRHQITTALAYNNISKQNVLKQAQLSQKLKIATLKASDRNAPAPSLKEDAYKKKKNSRKLRGYAQSRKMQSLDQNSVSHVLDGSNANTFQSAQLG